MFPTIQTLVKGSPQNSEKIKRIDHVTTGLINEGNYCFVNSSLQSFVPLLELSCYQDAIKNLLDNYSEKVQKDTTLISRKFPLHIALNEVLVELRTLIKNRQSLSPWPFIHGLEKSVGGKLSSQQSDAHELIAIILQVLQEENEQMQKLGINHPVPTLPFEGKTANQLTCSKCKRNSNPITDLFFMYELIVPQQLYDVNLANMLAKDNIEIIDDYSCQCCQVLDILRYYEASVNGLTDQENIALNYLKQSIDTLCVNTEFPPMIQLFVDTFYKHTKRSSPPKSVICKKSVMIKCPPILALHLSRSSYNGVHYAKTKTKVNYPENLMIPEYKDANSYTLIQYKLKSVILHNGSHDSGHYQTYRRKPDLVYTVAKPHKIIDTQEIDVTTTNMNKFKQIPTIQKKPFWLLSDTHSKEASLNTVLNNGNDVYMLYYEKVLGS